MTEQPTTPPDGGDPGPLAGERLAAERRSKGIELHEVARQLHLDEHKVRALEENAFDMLGAPVFAKGYLRKYAELVGLPVDGVLADYYRLNRSTGAPALIARRREQPARDINPGPWLAGIAVVLAVASAAWWWQSIGEDWMDDGDTAAPAPFADEAAVQQPSSPSRNAVTTPVAGNDAAPPVSDEPAADAPPGTGVTERQPTEPAPAASDPPLLELRVNFSGDCWTEITDASGERLFFGLGTAGRSVTVNGEPPLQVLLGDSASATLAVDGSSYPIPRSAQRGDTARLTIARP